MARDPKARHFSVTWDGGYLTATRGLLEYLYGQDFLDKVGAGAAKNVSVKSHSRTRVIGGPSKTVGAYSYSLIDYPRKVKSGAAGGQQIMIETGGKWFSARLGGSVQDFKAYLAGVGKPLKAFQFSTERGTEYSSAS